jgi:hypothetical protein
MNTVARNLKRILKMEAERNYEAVHRAEERLIAHVEECIITPEQHLAGLLRNLERAIVAEDRAEERWLNDMSGGFGRHKAWGHAQSNTAYVESQLAGFLRKCATLC